MTVASDQLSVKNGSGHYEVEIFFLVTDFCPTPRLICDLCVLCG